MVEQGTLWSNSELRTDQAEIPIQPISAPDEQGPRIEIGPYVKPENMPFLLRALRGEPYLLNPIRAGEAINFIFDPSDVRKRSRRVDFDTQMTLFSDLPPVLYPMLHTDKTLTLENIEERLIQEMGTEGIRYSRASSRYLELVSKLGNETADSSTSYVISAEHLLKKFRLQGERTTNIFFISGRFGEIHKGGERDTILRISQARRNGKDPPTYDAIRLGIDLVAYQAISGRRKGSPNPRMILFNLVNGKGYELRVDYNSFYLELIDAIIYSNLSMQAGYFENPHQNDLRQDIQDPNEPPTKKVRIYTSRSSVTLSAKETFERARNCLRRIAGRLPEIEKKYEFIGIN